MNGAAGDFAMKTGMKLIRAACVGLALLAAGTGVSQAAGEGGIKGERQPWTFSGVFGTFDPDQLQRGFQIYREVCAACHSARLLAFRNLSEEGGPEFSEAQVKALAAEYVIADPETEEGERPGIAADRWPSPFETEADARNSNNGALPPDLSVIAKARSFPSDFPFWIVDYFTAYQEGGTDYIYNLMVNYHEAPEGVELGEGQHYNAFYGGGLSMAPPLADGLITYEGDVPETVDQYARDVSAFLMWMAEPHMVSRKETGFRVMIVLVLLAGMMYLVKRKLWANEAH